MSYQIGTINTCELRFSQLDFNRFASLSKDNNPIHVDSAFAARTKFGRTVAHGMLLYSAISRCLSEQFPTNMQLSVKLKFPNPTYVDQDLFITQELRSKYQQPERLEISSRILHASGESGCDSLIVLSPSPGHYLEGGNFEEPVQKSHEESGDFKGLKIGQKANTSRAFTQSDINEYVDLCADFNHLHTNYEFVRANGFKNFAVPLPLIGGLFSFLLGTKLPGLGTNWLKLSFDVFAPVFLEEDIEAEVRISRIRAGKELVNLDVTAMVSGGRTICQGDALVLVKDVPTNG
jgi:acyl dehydratase